MQYSIEVNNQVEIYDINKVANFAYHRPFASSALSKRLRVSDANRRDGAILRPRG